MNFFKTSNFLLFFLFFTVLKSSAQDTIPTNPATGLVSVNDVIVLQNKSVLQLKQIAESFIATYSDKSALLGQKQTQYKKDKKLPLFTANEILNQDSALTYDCQMKIFISHNSLGIPSTTDYDIISLKINFYFKTNKVKYDITNFSHTYIGFKNGENGGKFENEKPDDFKRMAGSGKKKWIEIKQKSIEQAKQIANVIEETFKTNTEKQLDF